MHALLTLHVPFYSEINSKANAKQNKRGMEEGKE